jgi:trehalose 6-phosphate synthase/phosphatase
MTANLDIQVLPGHKVVEIKSTGASKAEFYTRYLSKKSWDFILAVGDDATDDALFRALPPGSATVRVGLAASSAVYNLPSAAEVTSVLKKLLEVREEDTATQQAPNDRPAQPGLELEDPMKQKEPATVE